MSRPDPPWLVEIKGFIIKDAPAQCAEFMDKRPDLANKLKALQFDGALRLNAFEFIALVINSRIYAQWAALLFPVRAPHLTPAAAQLLPASERLLIVKHCLGLIKGGHGTHAVAHLVSYTRDFAWYVHRGAVPDGKRTWRLWRLITHHRHLVNIAKKDHWYILRALLATCPFAQLPPGKNALTAKADELALKVVLNPPNAELVGLAVELGRKISPRKIAVASILPSGSFSHLVFDALQMANVVTTDAAFTFTESIRSLNLQFVNQTIALDAKNKVLLVPPTDVLWNQRSFREYAQRIALFSLVARGTDQQYRITQGIGGETYGFCLSALVGLYELHGSAITAISHFIDLVYRLNIGDRRDTVGQMLWSCNYPNPSTGKCGKRKKCFGLLIGPRTAKGGLFNPHNPLFSRPGVLNLFAWYHDVIDAFATSPFTRIVSHLATAGEALSDETKVHLRVFHRLLAKLHTTHPNIGPQDGAYGQPKLFSKAICKAIKSDTHETVKAYLAQWFLPNVSSLPIRHLQYRLTNSKRASVKAFVLFVQRRRQRPCAPGLPGLPPELVSIILSTFLSLY